MATNRDISRMRDAIALARKGEGMTRPNPPVGALVYKGSTQVGSGFHRKAGGPHAEIRALREAGSASQGGTLYATLEPCSTSGRTGPCTKTILESGIRRVVVGSVDPNPAHEGRGLTLLRRHGVVVEKGVLKSECDELIEPFKKWIRDGTPFVTLKLGMSLDGRIADRRGRSKWITGPESRSHVQGLRRRSDAILVGAGTARMDNPSLLPVPAKGRKPFRIVVAGSRRLPQQLKVLQDQWATRTLVAIPDANASEWETLHRSSTFELMVVSTRPDGKVSIPALLKKLGARGFLHLLCEGGGGIAEALIKAHSVDEFHFFYAPCLIGGNDSVPAISGKGWNLGDFPEVIVTHFQRSGNDLWIRAKPIND